MTCNEYRILIARYLDGTIESAEADQLHAHTLVCEDCRRELGGVQQVESAVTHTLMPVTPASQARESILSVISHDSMVPCRKTSVFAWSSAVAACVGLAAGLLIAVGIWGRTGTAPVAVQPAGPALAIRVVSLEGVVLAKHNGSAVWEEMTPAWPSHVGDVFQSLPKSAMVLGLADGSRVVLSANSRLLLEHYDGGARLKLDQGRMDLALNSPHPPFFVSTPNGRIEALGTEFAVAVE
jgi:hypothetical protein